MANETLYMNVDEYGSCPRCEAAKRTTGDRCAVCQARLDDLIWTVVINSPVGQLMAAHPEMTFGQAMTQLGYWKPVDAVVETEAS